MIRVQMIFRAEHYMGNVCLVEYGNNRVKVSAMHRV